MQTRLRLFLDWGITFDRQYAVPEKAQRKVAYASKTELESNILGRDNVYELTDDEPPSERSIGGQNQTPAREQTAGQSQSRQQQHRSPYNTTTQRQEGSQ